MVPLSTEHCIGYGYFLSNHAQMTCEPAVLSLHYVCAHTEGALQTEKVLQLSVATQPGVNTFWSTCCMSSDLSVWVQCSVAPKHASMHARCSVWMHRQVGLELKGHDPNEAKELAAGVTCEKRRVMNTLSSRNDLFSSNEDIKGVAILTIVR